MGMRRFHHPWDYPLDQYFPNRRRQKSYEGGAFFTDETENKFYVIVDEGTMADFLDERDATDREILDRLTTVLEFDSREERDAYLQAMNPKLRRGRE